MELWQGIAIYGVIGLLVVFTKVLFWGKDDNGDIFDGMICFFWPLMIPFGAVLGVVMGVEGFINFVHKMHVATSAEDD